jgi:hypothetical protein
MMLISCNKDELEVKALLQQHDWEQMTEIPGDSNYYSFKYFHRVKFSSEETYILEVDWGYVSHHIDTEVGRYKFEPGRDAIIFPDPVDTIVFDELGGGFYYKYFGPWNILQINDTLLMIETDTDYISAYNGYIWSQGDTFAFRAIK